MYYIVIRNCRQYLHVFLSLLVLSIGVGNVNLDRSNHYIIICHVENNEIINFMCYRINTLENLQPLRYDKSDAI